MSSRRHSIRPIVVNVEPDDTNSVTPSSPNSKSVRFASENSSSRPLTTVEAWSLYNFEIHARRCSDCFDPWSVYKQGGRLCDAGRALAQDVACHVSSRESEVYSTTKDDDSRLVRVEIPHGYTQLRQLLRSIERSLKSRRRSVAVVSHDKTYPRPARRPSSGAVDRDEAVVLEPASTADRSPRRPKYKTHRYSTVVVNDRVEDVSVKRVPAAETRERRGSLYLKDLERKQANYDVEIREPDRRRARDEGRRNSVWL
jgi:hypothetical protein